MNARIAAGGGAALSLYLYGMWRLGKYLADKLGGGPVPVAMVAMVASPFPLTLPLPIGFPDGASARVVIHTFAPSGASLICKCGWHVSNWRHYPLARFEGEIA